MPGDHTSHVLRVPGFELVNYLLEGGEAVTVRHAMSRGTMLPHRKMSHRSATQRQCAMRGVASSREAQMRAPLQQPWALVVAASVPCSYARLRCEYLESLPRSRRTCHITVMLAVAAIVLESLRSRRTCQVRAACNRRAERRLLALARRVVA